MSINVLKIFMCDVIYVNTKLQLVLFDYNDMNYA